MKKTTALAAIAATALLAITLAACTQTATVSEPTSKPGASSAPTAAPTETPVAEPVAIEGDRDGNGKLSEWEKSMLVKNAVRDYTLADGTVVSVDPAQPLPAAVVETIKSKTVGDAAGLQTQAESRSASYAAIIATLDAEAAATGRGVILVASSASAEGTFWVVAASGAKVAPFMGSTDKAATVAEATTWAESRGFTVIVL